MILKKILNFFDDLNFPYSHSLNQLLRFPLIGSANIQLFFILANFSASIFSEVSFLSLSSCATYFLSFSVVQK